MIVVRNIFQLHFGKAREGAAILKEAVAAMRPDGGDIRLLADVTGDFYTLVIEMTYPSLAEMESSRGDPAATDEWRRAYERFVPLVREGRREVFRILE